jgi:hypothetical protein
LRGQTTSQRDIVHLWGNIQQPTFSEQSEDGELKMEDGEADKTESKNWESGKREEKPET